MKDRIKILRKDLGLTQEKFAQRIGIKRNTLANYEIGRNEPIDGIIYSICREFNVSEEWLRDGTGEMFIEIDREDALMRWAGEVLKEKDGSFRKNFVHMLSRLDSDDWEALEIIALKLFEDKKKS